MKTATVLLFLWPHTWQSGTILNSDWFYHEKDFCYFRVDLPHQKYVEMRLKSDAKILSPVYLITNWNIISLWAEKDGKRGFVQFHIYLRNITDWVNIGCGMRRIEYLTDDGKLHILLLRNETLKKLKDYAN